MRFLRWHHLVLLGVASCESCDEVAVCCVEADGVIDAIVLVGEPVCGTDSATLVGTKKVGDEPPFNEEARVLDAACGDICCVTGDTRRILGFSECDGLGGSARRPEDCPADPSAEDCTCNEAGVQFTVVSGCSGPAFDDATEASFCRSHVEFNLGANPDTQTFTSGAEFGFPDCTVRITCP